MHVTSIRSISSSDTNKHILSHNTYQQMENLQPAELAYWAVPVGQAGWLPERSGLQNQSGQVAYTVRPIRYAVKLN